MSTSGSGRGRKGNLQSIDVRRGTYRRRRRRRRMMWKFCARWVDLGLFSRASWLRHLSLACGNWDRYIGPARNPKDDRFDRTNDYENSDTGSSRDQSEVLLGLAMSSHTITPSKDWLDGVFVSFKLTGQSVQGQKWVEFERMGCRWWASCDRFR